MNYKIDEKYKKLIYGIEFMIIAEKSDFNNLSFLEKEAFKLGSGSEPYFLGERILIYLEKESPKMIIKRLDTMLSVEPNYFVAKKYLELFKLYYNN